MIKLLLQIFTLKITAYSLLPETDYFGGDLFNVKNINSTNNCLSLCEKVVGCKLATWCEIDSTCYIKNVKTSPSYKGNCTSIDMYPLINVTDIPDPEETIIIPRTEMTNTERPVIPNRTSGSAITEFATFSTIAVMLHAW